MVSFELIKKITWVGDGTCSPQYLVIHSTANVGATALNHVTYWTNNPKKSVHFVTDWTNKVYNCVEWNHKCNHVGNGNRQCVGIELCETNDAKQFATEWKTAIEFSAWFLKQRGWGIDRLITHDDARRRWGGTDHTDPIAYFKKFGKTFQDFKNDTQKIMNGGVPAPVTPSKPASSGGSSNNFGGTYKCTVNKLYVRDQPSKKGKIITSYSKGQTVTLDNWYKSAEGYIWGRYTGAQSGKLRYVAVGKATGKPEPDDYLIKIS